MRPSISAPAGHDAVAGELIVLAHAEIGAAMGDEHVVLFEGALIEQQLDPFARGQLSLRVLTVNPSLAAAEPRHVALALELVEDLLHRLVRLPSRHRPKGRPPPV